LKIIEILSIIVYLQYFKEMGNELDYNYFLSGEDFDADYVLKTFKIVPLYYISVDYVKLKVKFFLYQIQLNIYIFFKKI
jgi:hypothetical protein